MNGKRDHVNPKTMQTGRCYVRSEESSLLSNEETGKPSRHFNTVREARAYLKDLWFRGSGVLMRVGRRIFIDEDESIYARRMN